jgi:hypothetical protein
MPDRQQETLSDQRFRLAEMLIRPTADRQWVECAVCGESYFTRKEALEAAENLVLRGVRLANLQLHDAVIHFLVAYGDKSGADGRELDEFVEAMREALGAEL